MPISYFMLSATKFIISKEKPEFEMFNPLSDNSILIHIFCYNLNIIYISLVLYGTLQNFKVLSVNQNIKSQ